jgi:AcrR family transcriptional regulator
MASAKIENTNATASARVRDHRVDVAEKKRLVMRARLVDATMRVFAEQSGATRPVIDDVIREAKVSRGTFYNYFDTLEEVLTLIGHDLSNQMTTEILGVYDSLEDPLQRFAVGFRLFLTRAMVDPKWAGFVTGTDAWAQDTLVDKYMSADLRRGKQIGTLNIEDTQVAADFLKGASAHGILALRRGVPDPVAYINASVRMAMTSMGCTPKLAHAVCDFSENRLRAWVSGQLDTARPLWAMNISPRHAQLLHGADATKAAAPKRARKPKDDGSGSA